jgi:hypothetical protein
MAEKHAKFQLTGILITAICISVHNALCSTGPNFVIPMSELHVSTGKF